MVVRLIKVKFCMVHIVICYTFIGQSSSEEWTNTSETTMVKLSNVTGVVHTDTDVNMPKGRSISTCMHHCTERNYASFVFFEDSKTCLCSSEQADPGNVAEQYTGVIYGERKVRVFTSYLQINNQMFKRIHRQPGNDDCLSLYELGYRENGVYVIQPEDGINVDVWCDMTNGGWTVIQRRQDGSEDFYRGWDEYKDGFGNKTGEYWLGLRYINILTQNDSSLFVEMETFEKDNMSPATAFAEYTTFQVNDESDEYRLSVTGFNGTCLDSLAFHNGWRFTTFDNDNDGRSFENCAEAYKGGWWYRTCHSSNLNGMYLEGAGAEYGVGINWSKCWGFEYSLKRVVMKIRRNV